MTVKLSVSVSPRADEDELLFVRQLGAECVYTWVADDRMDAASLTELRQKVNDAGLALHNVGNMGVGKCDRIHLALEGRDEKIEEFKQFLRNLSAAGIGITTFTWEQVGTLSSEGRRESRGASARHIDMDELGRLPFTHGRAYSEEEIWDNFAYFMREIIPVAEETGVRLALHPNDPPVPAIGGVPCLVHDFDSYKRAFEIAGSDALGMEFCTGCWLEGGDRFGDVDAGLRWCSEQGRICLVHFRNVSAPLPDCTETFLDNGYKDMYPLMKILVETGYEGTVALDHSPKFSQYAGRGSATAYAVGYMRALLERAEAECGPQPEPAR